MGFRAAPRGLDQLVRGKEKQKIVKQLMPNLILLGSLTVLIAVHAEISGCPVPTPNKNVLDAPPPHS